MTAPRAFFLQGDPGTGQRYALYHEPQGRLQYVLRRDPAPRPPRG